ncbi:MAG: sigma-70 family RNA polymerase sigma factor [bacterium]|nr:sigma-70 family RNA polymerase sigma factor [bacterium]
MPPTSSEVSRLLDAWSNGDTKALDQLMPLVADELRVIARRLFKTESAGHTLQPTALVNEAYIKLRGQRKVQWNSRAEFFGVAANMIRHILVDYARHRQAKKRGGDVLKIPLDEVFALPEEQDAGVIALDEALKDLAMLDPRQSRIVELRIFGGLKFQEIAELEKIGRTTVWREWKTALPWLRRELSRSSACRG